MLSYILHKFRKFIVYQWRVYNTPLLHLLKCDFIFKLKFQPFAPDDAVHYYFCREWSRDNFQPKLDLLVEEDMETTTEDEYMEGTIPEECMGGTIHDESMKEINRDESMKETIHDKSMEGIIHDESMEGTINDIEEENDEEENPYIKMMRSPLVVEGFLIKNKDNTTNIRKESKDLMNETGTLSALLSDDKKKNGKENKKHGKKAKKGRRAILFFFRLFGR
ncbi:uncharacterized protein LOC125681317 [Ostrea edulis]|uniref:uncharacterized protein LOC125681317 n=1 Tax=Ostrea edulis TaxID=37623 RepID=UPI0024AF0631|nr:uncharacterized protein LOC125681317 [Ostrea edulis]